MYYFSWLCSAEWAMTSSFTRFLGHTQRRAKVDRTPLGKWSTSRRDLYLTTHTTEKHPCPRWNLFFICSYLVLHCSGIGLSMVVFIVSYCMLWIFPAGKIRRLRSGEIRTHDRNRRAVVGLRTRGYWDRQNITLTDLLQGVEIVLQPEWSWRFMTSRCLE
jgi:hypothetical protein